MRGIAGETAIGDMSDAASARRMGMKLMALRPTPVACPLPDRYGGERISSSGQSLHNVTATGCSREESVI